MGDNILTATESPKARTLTLSDEVWEGLSSDDVHKIVMTVTQGDDQIVRTFQFKKFVYDYSCLYNLFDGIARATRIQRSNNKQIVAADFPKEILKISAIKENITPSYIDVTVPYVAGGTVVVTSAGGDTYGANLDPSGVTRVTVDYSGLYTVRGYVGNSPSSSATVTIAADGDTVSCTLQWIKLTVTVEEGATVVASLDGNTVSGDQYRDSRPLSPLFRYLDSYGHIGRLQLLRNRDGTSEWVWQFYRLHGIRQYGFRGEQLGHDPEGCAGRKGRQLLERGRFKGSCAERDCWWITKGYRAEKAPGLGAILEFMIDTIVRLKVIRKCI